MLLAAVDHIYYKYLLEIRVEINNLFDFSPDNFSAQYILHCCYISRCPERYCIQNNCCCCEFQHELRGKFSSYDS